MSDVETPPPVVLSRKINIAWQMKYLSIKFKALPIFVHNPIKNNKESFLKQSVVCSLERHCTVKGAVQIGTGTCTVRLMRLPR
jgi:hypothetical protein